MLFLYTSTSTHQAYHIIIHSIIGTNSGHLGVAFRSLGIDYVWGLEGNHKIRVPCILNRAHRALGEPLKLVILTHAIISKTKKLV